MNGEGTDDPTDDPPKETPAEWLETQAELKQELKNLKESGDVDLAKARDLNRQLRDHRRKK